ncbi:MAG: SGNH/GDSL hydrolase family protein, partial [Oscillospiraceae bacterium]|nr:SGNH/GDSL hydrolase family protein [Oscillospiraceae bacterium]
ADGSNHPSQIVPPLYDKMGFSIAKLENGRSIKNEHWNFRRQPDLIVINLGTNDATYTGNDPEKQAQFADAYRAFLKAVRRNNPNAHLLCMLGTMGQTLCAAVSEAVRAYTSETGDSDIRFLAAAEQQEADGFGIDWHPSAATHEKAAAVLSDYIRTWLEI